MSEQKDNRFFVHPAALDLERLLFEQDESPAEIASLLPTLQQLQRWPAPQPTPAQVQHLLRKLAPALPQFSPLRTAVRDRYESTWGKFSLFLEIAQAQVSILSPAFWLLSVLVTFLGVLIIFMPATNHTFVLRILGPGLAYLATLVLFRGMRQGMLECELSCPPSLQQLTLARLLIVLSYDAGPGLFVCLLLSLNGEGNFLLLMLHWLMPLLLLIGLALLLSLRYPLQLAVSIAYSCWLVLAIILLRVQQLADRTIASPLALKIQNWSVAGELCMGLLGIVLLLVALQLLSKTLPRQWSM